MVIQTQDSNREKTTKGVTKLRARVQDRSAKRKLLPAIEEGEEVERSREEDCLDEAKKEPRHEQADVVVHYRHEG